jgi:membrane protease YdiL (CAAX protease family)
MPQAPLSRSNTVNEAVNDAVTRMIGIVGLGGIALIHALQAPEAFEETAYLGALFIGAIVASLVLSAVLTRSSDQRVWTATGGLAGAIMLGYVLTRTSGLPDATLDVGNWTEPLGLASLVAEGLVLCVTAGVLASRGVVSGRAIVRALAERGYASPASNRSATS